MRPSGGEPPPQATLRADRAKAGAPVSTAAAASAPAAGGSRLGSSSVVSWREMRLRSEAARCDSWCFASAMARLAVSALEAARASPLGAMRAPLPPPPPHRLPPRFPLCARLRATAAPMRATHHIRNAAHPTMTTMSVTATASVVVMWARIQAHTRAHLLRV